MHKKQGDVRHKWIKCSDPDLRTDTRSSLYFLSAQIRDIAMIQDDQCWGPSVVSYTVYGTPVHVVGVLHTNANVITVTVKPRNIEPLIKCWCECFHIPGQMTNPSTGLFRVVVSMIFDDVGWPLHALESHIGRHVLPGRGFVLPRRCM